MVKMVKLLPQYAMMPFIGGLVMLGLSGYLLWRGLPLWLALIVLVGGSALLYVLSLSYGVSEYQNRLAWLYQNLEPERFIEKFEKMLPRAKKYPVQEVTVRAHLANAYAALGQFEKALELLDGVPDLSGAEESEQVAAKLLVLNNKAQIYFQIEQADKGKACLDELRATLPQATDALRKSYEENERILQCHYEALTGVCTSDAYLRTLLTEGSTALFRVNISFLLARVYLSQGEKNMARSYMEETYEKGRDWLWPTQKAQEMMKEIPELH